MLLTVEYLFGFGFYDLLDTQKAETNLPHNAKFTWASEASGSLKCQVCCDGPSALQTASSEWGEAGPAGRRLGGRLAAMACGLQWPSSAWCGQRGCFSLENKGRHSRLLKIPPAAGWEFSSHSGSKPRQRQTRPTVLFFTHPPHKHGKSRHQLRTAWLACSDPGELFWSFSKLASQRQQVKPKVHCRVWPPGSPTEWCESEGNQGPPSPRVGPGPGTEMSLTDSTSAMERSAPVTHRMSESLQRLMLLQQETLQDSASFLSPRGKVENNATEIKTINTREK